MNALKSIFIWVTFLTVITLWLPVLAVTRLFDRDPARYFTGRTYRRLGWLLTRLNPLWKMHLSGVKIDNPRLPYVVVCNHQSLGDIPVISNLPWEMKWVAKEELFRIPVLGWQMRLAGDIPVNRKGVRRWEQVATKAGFYLENRCSVMIFPEGTRSKDGELQRFTDGAFALAVKHQVPVLPLVVDGTSDCLPKETWVFGGAVDIRLKVLEPIPTEGLQASDVADLRERARTMIARQLAEWRGMQ